MPAGWREMFSRLLDWRLRYLLEKHGVPDLPEVRTMMRLAWWNGFTFGALQKKADDAAEKGREAILRHAQDQAHAEWLEAVVAETVAWVEETRRREG